MVRFWKKYRLSTMLIMCAAVLLLASCGNGETETKTSASTTTSSAKIVITGVVNSNFTPEEISLFKVADNVGINFAEKFPCGVSLQFPINLKPGSHPINDRLHSPSGSVWGQYSPDCGKTGIYLSTGGTLNLTSSDGKYAGTFEFAAGFNNDESKKLKISGSFTDLTLQ